MEKTYCVYVHTNTINNKKYIGLTKQPPELRWGSNGRNYQDKCPVFWCAIKKYGWEAFSHEIVASDLTKREACDLEIELIEKYRTQEREYGYNMLAGGDTPTITPEIRAKMSKAMMGNKNGLGKPCSEEKKKKIYTPLGDITENNEEIGETHESKYDKNNNPHLKRTLILKMTSKGSREVTKEDFINAMNIINKKYNKELCKVEIKDTYSNMKDYLEDKMYVVDIAYEALKENGLSPISNPIRGGTDGAKLTLMGLNTPNLGTGGYNCHGPYEFACLEEMEIVVDIIKEIEDIKKSMEIIINELKTKK